MNKRMWPAFALACAFLLLLSSASQAKSLSDTKEFGKKEFGARVIIPPQPTMGGSDPGDDDTPDRSGHGDLGLPTATPQGALAGDPSSRSTKDWWASFRLQLLTVLRVWK